MQKHEHFIAYNDLFHQSDDIDKKGFVSTVDPNHFDIPYMTCSVKRPPILWEPRPRQPKSF